MLGASPLPNNYLTIWFIENTDPVHHPNLGLPNSFINK